MQASATPRNGDIITIDAILEALYVAGKCGRLDKVKEKCEELKHAIEARDMLIGLEGLNRG